MMERSDILALSLVYRITSSEVIRLGTECDNLDDALERIGCHVLDMRERALEQLEKCSAVGVQLVCFCDQQYPQRLRAMDKPPALLYVWGTLPDPVRKAIAVVGTRACSVSYGKPVTELFVREWVQDDCVIVSGLANGIDTIAHEATLRNGGCTVAVIASGIDRITPAPARALAARIVEHGGCVISEYACGVAALPPYFPARNRIISGLCDAVAVIESKRKGGALITAAFAKEQGIPVYAVPGSVLSEKSSGCNQLLANGNATVLSAASDVFGARRNAVTTHDETTTTLTAEDAAITWQCSIAEALARLFVMECSGTAQSLPGGRFLVRA